MVAAGVALAVVALLALSEGRGLTRQCQRRTALRPDLPAPPNSASRDYDTYVVHCEDSDVRCVVNHDESRQYLTLYTNWGCDERLASCLEDAIRPRYGDELRSCPDVASCLPGAEARAAYTVPHRGARVPDLEPSELAGSRLDISECEINALPAGWLRGAAVSQLEVRGNRIVSVGAGAFSGPLTEIILSYNQVNLTIGSGTFAGLPKLKSLDLSWSNIVSIAPDFIGASATLAELNLHHNELIEIPPGAFAGLGALRKLDLAENELASLAADAFRGLGALRELRLGENQLVTLPPALFRPLASLRSLSVSNNLIEVLPDFLFKDLASLRKVFLDGNRVRAVAPDAFEGVDLYELDLTYNRLTLDEPEAAERSPFHRLESLGELLLSHNAISRVSRDWTAGMPDLYKLDLSSNNFTQLHVSRSQLGERNCDLWVDLTSNRIASPTLDEDASGAPDSDDPIVHFTLDANPLVCDCALKHAARCGWNPHERRCGVRFEMGDANCVAPPDLKGYWPSNAFKRLQCPEH